MNKKDLLWGENGRSSDLFEATLMDSVRVLTRIQIILLCIQFSLLFYPASSNLHYLLQTYECCRDLGVNSATKQEDPRASLKSDQVGLLADALVSLSCRLKALTAFKDNTLISLL